MAAIPDQLLGATGLGEPYLVADCTVVADRNRFDQPMVVTDGISVHPAAVRIIVDNYVSELQTPQRRVALCSRIC